MKGKKVYQHKPGKEPRWPKRQRRMKCECGDDLTTACTSCSPARLASVRAAHESPAER